MDEAQNRPQSSMFVRMFSRAGAKGGSSGQFIRATLPYSCADISIIIVSRAFGFVADKDILEHIYAMTLVTLQRWSCRDRH